MPTDEEDVCRAAELDVVLAGPKEEPEFVVYGMIKKQNAGGIQRPRIGPGSYELANPGRGILHSADWVTETN